MSQVIEVLNELNTAFEDFKANLDGRLSAVETAVDEISVEMQSRSLNTSGRVADAGSHEDYLEASDRLVDYIRRERGITPPEGGVNLGNLMRAMVLGPRNELEAQALHRGADSAGGYAVPDEYAAEVIDLMRAKTAVVQAGARTVPLDAARTHFLRIESDPVAGWRLERDQVKESDMTFGRTTFIPQSLAVIVKATRELLEDGMNVDSALRNALAAAFAQEIDRVALFGSGEDAEPRGVVNTPGVQVYELAENGEPVTSYTPIVRARGMLLQRNANEPTAAIMAPRTATAFEELTDSTGQPLQRPRAIADLPFLATTLVPIDEEYGTAQNASRVVVGDYRQLWIGIRTGFRIEVLTELFAGTMEVAFLAHLRADVQVAQPPAFVDIRGFIPAEE